MRLEIQRAVARPAPEWPHQSGELARWGAAIGRGKPYSCASTNFLDYQWRFASETPANHLLRFGQQIASGAQIDYYLLGTFDQANSAQLEPVHRFLLWHAEHGEQLTGTRSLARVALYHSRAPELHKKATARGQRQVDCFRGAYRLLLEGRVPFDFVSDERMADADAVDLLSAYDAIVMANVSCLSDAEAAALDAYVEQGGTIIATGETGRYDERGRQRDGLALNTFPASRVAQTSEGLETYVAIDRDELDFPQTRLLHLDGWYFHAEPKPAAEGLLTLMPVQDYGPPELCFPRATESEDRGVLLLKSGQGRVAYLPWLPEWLYFRDGLPEHRSLILQLIGQASRPPVLLEGAGPLELTVRAKPLGETVVHLVNFAGQRGSAYEEPPEIHGLRLGLFGATGTAEALVDGTVVQFGPLDADGYGWANVPAVRHFEVIVLPASATAL
jgi:hypothetical protein